MNKILKISGLVSVYLAIVALGAFFSFPTNLQSKNTSRAVSALIIPHHLVASKQIKMALSFVSSSRKTVATRRIVLLAPSHFFRSEGKVLTTKRKWVVPNGEILPDSTFIDYLVANNFADINDKIVFADHAVTGLVPYIEEAFPGVQIVPLLLCEPVNEKNAKILAELFAKQFNDDTLVISSMDFSHYLPKTDADKQDSESIKALYDLDFNFFKNEIHADARQVLMVLSEYLRLRGDVKFTLLFHTNSAVLIANPFEKSTTSHIGGIYEYGEKAVPTEFCFFEKENCI